MLRKFMFATSTLGVASVAFAAPTPATFVAKAGASDKFEIESSKLVAGSADPKVKAFAQKMITDHMKSTADIKAAATADGIKPKPPVLDTKQAGEVAALKAAAGKKRDALYVQQQKASHVQALALHQEYSASGTAPHLKAAAGKIVPIVQSHKTMVDEMPAA